MCMQFLMPLGEMAYIYMCNGIYMCVYMYIYVCIYVYMCVCVYIYKHLHN